MMNLSLTAAEEAKLAAQARARGTTPEALVREAILPVIAASETKLLQPQEAADAHRPISQIIAGIMKDSPAEELAKLPKDGASEHDHYIYGWPKRNQ